MGDVSGAVGQERERLLAALVRLGWGRPEGMAPAGPERDPYGGLAVFMAKGDSSDPTGFVSVRGRLSPEASRALTAVLESYAWRCGQESATPDGLAVPRLGVVVVDSAQIERPGRVVDWDGAGQLVLAPPAAAGPEWVATVDAVRLVDAGPVDVRAIER